MFRAFRALKPHLPPAQTHSVQQGFTQGPIFVLNVAKRFIKFSAIGIVALGLTTAILFEGTHIWVENVGLALPQDDAETRKWEWDIERENWSGDLEAAGTDPALGFRGRHLVRAAWQAQNWGASQGAVVVSSDSVTSRDGLAGPRGIIIIDPRLVKAESYLRDAISIAEEKSGKLRPWTMTHLLLQHASVLERMGSESMIAARSQYQRAWNSQPFIAPQSARIALKVGNLNQRLGNADDALAWWDRAIHISRGSSPHPEQNGVPAAMPSSPYAQRLLLSTLSSISACYATAGKFSEAQSIAESSLALIRSVRQPESIASISSPHALHALTLLQRSSVLSIYLAEVLYAQKKPTIVSTQWLASAAECSERVVRALTGLPLNNGNVDQLALSSSNAVQSSYLHSTSLQRPAASLYRDSRRTAAEAWNLTGILIEKQNPSAALTAYENAVRLAGSNAEYGEPADKTLKVDWEVIWSNYTRLKSKLQK
ncbi:hypothetical protein BT96DRAFT_1041566 [Gymnopus androsaceus JB14]|uniref:TPR-like protein n=1 Tax=Gymnopus androsaceus JB14 TaxID=1447944 RepID=A0A6A4HFP7_9AGAR|nr:hypothetical protein BT96DRAFT_1041566 [Gymnopus androsaceus JB14]